VDPSNSIAEVLMTKILVTSLEHSIFRVDGKLEDPKELQIVDCVMRRFGPQWRLIFWVRCVKGSKLAERLGTGIRTLILHEGSFVEVVADAPLPEVRQGE